MCQVRPKGSTIYLLIFDKHNLQRGDRLVRGHADLKARRESNALKQRDQV